MNEYYINGSKSIMLWLLVSLLIAPTIIAQNTIGTLTYLPEQTSPGYNLLYPLLQGNVYLTNNCGQVVHEWAPNDEFIPGSSAYLLENGHLIKCASLGNGSNPIFNAGGASDFVIEYDWEGNIVWEFSLSNEQYRLHHDIEVLPNGNIVMMAWEYKTVEEAIQAGRNPDLLLENALWSDYIFEVQPDYATGGYEIVWEWRAWDHLIQDFDASKDNYGVIAEHPELININYDFNGFT